MFHRTEHTSKSAGQEELTCESLSSSTRQLAASQSPICQQTPSLAAITAPCNISYVRYLYPILFLEPFSLSNTFTLFYSLNHSVRAATRIFHLSDTFTLFYSLNYSVCPTPRLFPLADTFTLLYSFNHSVCPTPRIFSQPFSLSNTSDISSVRYLHPILFLEPFSLSNTSE